MEVTGVPPGSETKLRVAQVGNAFISLESYKEPGHFVTISQTGLPAPGALDMACRQLTPRLLVSCGYFCWFI